MKTMFDKKYKQSIASCSPNPTKRLEPSSPTCKKKSTKIYTFFRSTLHAFLFCFFPPRFFFSFK